MTQWRFIAALSLALLALSAFAQAPASPPAAPSQHWQISQLTYVLREEWQENPDPENQHAQTQDVRSSQIELRSGEKLKKKKKIGDGFESQRSPKGDQIAFLTFCQGGYTECMQLGVMNADGSNKKTISGTSRSLEDQKTTVSSFAWSPVKKKLAFVEAQSDGDGEAKIVVINPDGSGRKEIATFKRSECASNPFNDALSWSPDGHLVAFNACDQGFAVIVVADRKGHRVRSLIRGRGAVWSPHDNLFGFLYGPTTQDPNTSIYMAGAAGNDIKFIFKDKVGMGGLAWLPDGKSIAFTSNRDDKNRSEIYRIGIDGTDLQKIVSASKWKLSFSNPIFSPDATQLVVEGHECCPISFDFDNSNSSHLMLFDLTTNKQETLTNGSNASVVWELK